MSLHFLLSYESANLKLSYVYTTPFRILNRQTHNQAASPANREGMNHSVASSG